MAGRDPGEGDPPEAGRRLELTEEERLLLLRACERYRAAIPTYLKSREEERRQLEGLVRKLSGGR